jgi:hypothetical protein
MIGAERLDVGGETTAWVHDMGDEPSGAGIARLSHIQVLPSAGGWEAFDPIGDWGQTWFYQHTGRPIGRYLLNTARSYLGSHQLGSTVDVYSDHSVLHELDNCDDPVTSTPTKPPKHTPTPMHTQTPMWATATTDPTG